MPSIAAQNMQPDFTSLTTTLSDTLLPVAVFLVIFITLLSVVGGILSNGADKSASAKPAMKPETATKPSQEKIAQWSEEAARVLAVRGEFANWLTDESYALRNFIWDADRLKVPEAVARVKDAEEAYEAIEKLKTDNAAAIAALDARDPATPLGADTPAAAQAAWLRAKSACDSLNERASLSAFYVTGYRPQLPAPDPSTVNYAHRITHD